MISSAIRIVSRAICLVLIASFTMFVVDELSSASTRQSGAVANSTPAPAVVRDAHGREIDPARTQLRAKVDELNDRITATAESMVAGQSPLVMRGFPFVVGMLLFGLGGHFLASWLALSRGPRFGEVPIDREFRTTFTPGYR
ncbi:MAG: hypothetical protein WAO61_01640 [Solirubrobacterales bacterium]